MTVKADLERITKKIKKPEEVYISWLEINGHGSIKRLSDGTRITINQDELEALSKRYKVYENLSPDLDWN